VNEQEALRAAINEPIRLVAYDPAWAPAFAAERERLLAQFPSAFIEIQHIGSTAVPGLPAKPIIDLLAGVRTMADARALHGPLAEAGYTTSRAFNAALTDRQWFMRAAGGHRTHHLHVVEHGAPTWLEHLRFRDVLRARPDLVQHYAALKAELAQRHTNDREAYTDAKAAFVRFVLDAGT
jgi:GrpB-like predicted nucleotidyltransferase (UPF0157 family)